MSTDPQDIHHKKGKFLPLFLLFVALLTSAVFGVLYFLHGGGNVEEVNANSNVETRPVEFTEIEKYLPVNTEVEVREDGSYSLTQEQFETVLQNKLKEEQSRIEDFDTRVEDAIKQSNTTSIQEGLYEQVIIDPEKGGSLQTGNISVEFPKGFYSEILIISFKSEKVNKEFATQNLEKIYNLTAQTLYGESVSKFDKPITIRTKLTGEELAKIKVDPSITYFFNEETQKWEKIETKIDGDEIVAQTTHFTTFLTSNIAPKEEPATECGYIVDDSDPSSCFSTMGSVATWQLQTSGYKGTALYVNRLFPAFAFWVPKQDGLTGRLEVKVSIPKLQDGDLKLHDGQVSYWVLDKNSITIVNVNQKQYEGKVISFGEFEFEGTGGASLMSTPIIGEDYQIADAVSFGEGIDPDADLAPPMIEDVNAMCYDGKLYVDAKITDDGSGVKVAYVYLDGTYYEMSNDGDRYAAEVPCLTGAKLNYFIFAYDNANNEAIWSPTRGYTSRGALGFDLGIPPWAHYLDKARFASFNNEYTSAKAGSCNPYCPNQFLGDPVNSQNGNLFEQFNIVKVSGRPEIELNASYNSLGTGLTIFGENWTHSYNYHLNIMSNHLFKGVFVTYPDGRVTVFKGIDLVPSPGIFDSLTKTANGYELKLSDQTKVDFDSFGDVSRIEDTNGNGLSFAYLDHTPHVNLSKIESITSDGGRKITFQYNDNGLVSSVTAPEGKTINLEYNGGDDLVKVIDANGGVVSYEYSDHSIIKKTTPKGHTAFVNTYDAKRRVIKQQADESFVQEYAYASTQTVVEDANGSIAKYNYVDGLFSSVVDENNKQTTYEYNSDKKLTGITDPEGKKTVFNYDSKGNQILEKDALGQETKREFNSFNKTLFESVKQDSFKYVYNYDSKGNLTKITDPAGKFSTFKYDQYGQVIESIDYNGNKTSYAYSAQGDLIKITDALNGQTRFTYDGLGRKLTETKPSNSQYSYTYNKVDNITKISGPDGFILGFEYDGNNHLMKETDANGGETKYEYDGSENLVKITNQLGYETKVEFGDMNEMLKKIDPEGRITQYSYNPVYDVTKVTEATGTTNQAISQIFYNGTRVENRVVDPEGRVLLLELDPLYRVTKQTSDANGLQASKLYKYNPRGAISEETDANGNKTTYKLDVLDRVVEAQDAEGNITKYAYDANGNVVDMTNPRGFKTTYTYDALNRLVKATDAKSGVTTFSYDANSNLVKQVDQKGTITQFKYNSLDRLVQKIENVKYTCTTTDCNLKTVYEYDKHGNLIKLTNPKGFSTQFKYDKAHRNTEIIDATGSSTKFEYDKIGNLVKVTDRNGNVTTQSYDELNRVVVEINAENQKRAYAYDKVDNLVRSVDAKNNPTTLTYDGLNRLISTKDALNGVRAFNYDLGENVLKVTDENSNPTSYAYDKINRVVEQKNPEGHKTNYLYDRNSNLAVVVDAKGNTTKYSYDELDRLVQKTDALEGKYIYSYDAVGNVIKETDENGHLTSYVLDGLYRVTKITDAEGKITKFEYDKNSNTVKVTDGNGHATTFAYDNLDRTTSETNPEIEKIDYKYDKEGNLTDKTAPDGIVTHYNLDKLYQLKGVIENFKSGQPENASINVDTNYTYDANGNLVEIKNPNDNITKFEYDALNRQIKEVDALGNSWTYQYDPAGNRTLRVDANGKRTNYSYYPDDELKEVKYQGAYNLTYSYDPNNNKTQIKDSIGTSLFNYDALNRNISVKDSLGRNLQYAYDPVGNRTSVVYSDNSKVNYGYYKNDWLKNMTDPAGKVTSYTRDSVGNTTKVTNPNSTVSTISYDKADRALNVTNKKSVNATTTVNSQFIYTYNDAGYRTKTDATYAWRNPKKVTTNYSYDALRRLTKSTDSEGVFSEYAYDRAGNRLSLNTNDNPATSQKKDALNQQYTYNDINQLITVLEGNKNDTKLQRQSKYDKIAQSLYALQHEIKAQKNKHITATTANELDTLVTELLSLVEGTTHDNTLITQKLTELKTKVETVTGIDNEGVRNSLLAKLKKAEESNNGQNDKLQAINFEYDANGNRVNKEFPGPQGPKVQGSRYSYDPENRLASVVDYQGNATGGGQNVRAETTYQYDGIGRRLEKTYDPKLGASGIKTTQYAYDNLDPVAEYSIWNNQRSNYYRGDQNRIAEMQNFPTGTTGQKYWYEYDGLGSVAGVTKDKGQSEHNYRYNDFGLIEPQTGNFTEPHNQYTYTGQLWDSNTDLYEFYARAYDPTYGVWLQQDIYRGQTEEPMSLHRYMYVNQSPITYKDLYGYNLYTDARDGVNESLGELAASIETGTQMVIDLLDPQGPRPQINISTQQQTGPLSSVSSNPNSQFLQSYADEYERDVEKYTALSEKYHVGDVIIVGGIAVVVIAVAPLAPEISAAGVLTSTPALVFTANGQVITTLAVGTAIGGYSTYEGVKYCNSNQCSTMDYLMIGGNAAFTLYGGYQTYQCYNSTVNYLNSSNPFPGYDSTIPPRQGFVWKGSGQPGSGQGSWYNPITGEKYYPDLNHSDPIGEHWDYTNPQGEEFRIYPDGRMVPK